MVKVAEGEVEVAAVVVVTVMAEVTEAIMRAVAVLLEVAMVKVAVVEVEMA